VLAVVVFHCLFERGESAVHLFAVRHIYLSGSRPDDNDALARVLLLELAYVLTQRLGHLPACLAVFHVVAVETFGVVLVESSLHRDDFLQLVAHGFDVLFLQNLGIHGCLVGVLRIYIPCSEDYIVELGQWHDVGVVQILLLASFAYANLVVLSHRPDGLSQSFACHEYTGHECRCHGTASYDHDSEFPVCGSNVCLFHFVVFLIIMGL